MKHQIVVGLDAKRIVRNGTGLGSYGRTLANDLADVDSLDLRLYAPDKGREDLRGQVPERDNLHYVFPPDGLSSLGKAYWRSRGIIGQLQRDGVQVFHGLSGELPIGIRKSGVKSVVTIHDLIFMRHPEYYNWIDTKIYTWKFRQTVKEADCIVAISECTRRDIVELGGVDVSKIDLIYQSCAQRFTREKGLERLVEVRDRYQLPRRYVLMVGSIEARKNALLAVRALHHLPADVHLVLVGKPTPYSRDLVAEAGQEGLLGRVHLYHGISDDDLPAFYVGAEVFVYPSRYEGFGIPIIEAIRMGLPVAACTGSCLEEAGGPDCLYVDPDDAEGLAVALSHLLVGAHGRENRVLNSQKYVERFANSDAANSFASVYASLV